MHLWCKAQINLALRCWYRKRNTEMLSRALQLYMGHHGLWHSQGSVSQLAQRHNTSLSPVHQPRIPAFVCKTIIITTASAQIAAAHANLSLSVSPETPLWTAWNFNNFIFCACCMLLPQSTKDQVSLKAIFTQEYLNHKSLPSPRQKLFICLCPSL